MSLILILCIQVSFASVGKETAFNLKVPRNWQQMKGFYGVPFTYLGPKSSNGIRPTIQVIPTEQKMFTLDGARIKQFDEKNKAAKERWLAKSNGYLLSYKPAELKKIGKLDVYVSQATYKYGNNGFEAKTYFTFCDKKLLQIKSLTSLAQDSGMKENDKIIESFQCKN